MKMKKAYNSDIFYTFTTSDGTPYSNIRFKGEEKNLPLDSEEFRMEYKSIQRALNGKMVSRNVLEQVMEELQLDAYENQLDYVLEDRIFPDAKSNYYNLNDGHGTVICMEDGKTEKCTVETPIFRNDKNIKEQVSPNLKVKPSRLPKLLGKNG